MSAPRVIFEDNHLLVLDKPAGLATMGTESAPSLHRWAVDYLRHKYHKPGRVFLGVVSRLDAMTSGVIVFPRTSKSASRLTPQFQPAKQSGNTSQATKVYLAVVDGKMSQSRGVWTDHVYKDDQAKRMRVATGKRADAKLARLEYTVVAQATDQAIVAVRLLTGRKHQIRLQFSHRGHSILGDQKYQSNQSFASGIALHSWKLFLEHPTQKTIMQFSSDPPRSWQTLGKDNRAGAPPTWADAWEAVRQTFSLR